MKRNFQVNSRSRKIVILPIFILTGLLISFNTSFSKLNAQCPNGLTNYWTFNDDNAGITKDTINTCHGSSGMSSGTAPLGQVGRASGFDGSRYVAFTAYPDYFWTNSLSVVLWCKFSSLTDDPMVMVGYDRPGSTHWWIGAEATTGRPTFYLYDDTRTGSGVVASDIIHDNTWHFLAATYNESESALRLYVDGVVVADSTMSYSNPFTADSVLGMGAMYRDASWKFFYTGLLDEVALFNRALTSYEISQLYVKGLNKSSYCSVINSKPEIISQPEMGLQLGDSYSYNVEASGTPDPTYSLIVSPAGMTIDDITGEINWDPSAAGTYSVLVQAENIAGNTTQAFSIKVVNPCIDEMLTYFTFEEGAGTTTYDDAYYITGILQNNPSWSPGRAGGGLTFDGITQYMTFPDDKDYYDWNVGGSFTIELWSRSFETLDELQVMIGRETDGSTHWWVGTQSATGNAAFFLYDEVENGGGLIGTTPINDGEWHHLVAVRDAASGSNKLFVDGILEADSAFLYTTGFVSDADVQVANFLQGTSHNFHFEGTLDEIAIYNRALTHIEINEHFSKGLNNYGYCSNFTLAPEIISNPVARCYVNQQYVYKVSAVGIPAPVFNLSGAPTGFSINTFTGEITGIPSTAGDYPITVTATNASGSDEQSFTLEVLESCIGNTSFYFDCEEEDGDILFDVFSPVEGYLVNNPDRIPGLVGSAIQFNGTDQRAFIPKDVEYDWANDQSFTMELWCMPGSITESHQVMMGRDVPESTHWWIGTEGTTGYPAFYLYDADREGGGIVGNSTIHDGDWHHLAVVRDAGSDHIMLYVDGELQADSVRVYANNFAADINIQLANLYKDNVYQFFYEGKLDETAIYKRALTADEIRGHFRHGLTGLNYCDAAFLGPYIILEPFH